MVDMHRFYGIFSEKETDRGLGNFWSESQCFFLYSEGVTPN